ncbi:MAG: hypothetical protein JWQ16_288 [Novosphingobium sp.]|nr:hypothetical protein [Novosphingobium sp.]
MSLRIVLASVALCLLVVPTAGCVQYPTEKQQVVDLRPQISFNFDTSNMAHAEARVLVDGLDAGRLGDFVADRASLRLLPGTHVVRVVDGARTLLDQRVYLGDGVTRSFEVQ